MNKQDEESTRKIMILPLPKVVVDLWASQQELVKHYAHTGLKFTLDGRLVGDIAEAVALEYFDLNLPDQRTGGVDALTRDGKSVQIKATGSKKAGPAFTPGTGVADYLIFFQMDFCTGTATLIYNGLEAPVRKELLPKSWSRTKRINLYRLQQLAAQLVESNALPLRV